MDGSAKPQTSAAASRLLKLARTRPVVRPRDAAAEGIHTGTLTRMARAGKLEKLGPGRYRLATSDVTESHSLVLACSIVPSTAGTFVWKLSLMLSSGWMTSVMRFASSSWPGLSRNSRCGGLRNWITTSL